MPRTVCPNVPENTLSGLAGSASGSEVSDETSPVRVEAVIIRTLRAGRVGVEFVQFENGERERLQRFIRGLIRHRGS